MEILPSPAQVYYIKVLSYNYLGAYLCFLLIAITFRLSYTNKLAIIPALRKHLHTLPFFRGSGLMIAPRQHPQSHRLVEVLVPALNQIFEYFPGTRQRLLGS